MSDKTGGGLGGDRIINRVESQYIFKNEKIKARLIKQEKNWYVGEWKDHNPDSQWFPWICGTAEWMGLTEQDKKWAIAK